METKKINILHEENKQWQNDLLFYKDELKIMKNRLAEIAAKNTSKDLLARVEHFQNQFIIQTSAIDNLAHEINLNNDAINREILKNEVAVDHRSMPDHVTIRENIAYFTHNMSALKMEFNTFLSKWM
jgi:hypothetical protein